MKKLLLVSLCLLMLCITQVFAQNRTVTGTVTAKDDGLPIPGVTVKVKGSTVGTQTNTAGKFTLSVPSGAVLVFSFIGYETTEIPVKKDVIILSLNVASKQLGEVVVTGALGIKKQEKEVGYATTRITGATANETNVIDPINGLTGKVAGLVIQQTNEGINPTIKVNLRGNRSLLGNNGALFVLDGVPVSPSIIQSLNPSDIEDYNVLNGSGAAALYGSEASNGAIVITTKKGTSNGKPVITYSNSLQLQQVANLPKEQTSYGQYGGEGNSSLGTFVDPVTGFSRYVPFENELWGPAFNGQLVQVGAYPAGSATGPVLTVPYSSLGKNPVKEFFQTGVTEQNNVSLAQGDSKNSFYLGVQDIYQKGITPEDEGEKIATHLAVTRTFGILKIDLSTNFSRNTSNTTGGEDYTGNNNLYDNILQFPANLNINAPYFKNTTDPNSFGNASNYFSGYSTNPWWTIQNNRTKTQSDVFSGNLNMTLSPTKWLDASYRVSDSFGNFQSKNEVSAVTFSPYALNNPLAQANGFGFLSFPNGVQGKTTDIIGYGDGTGSIVNAGGTVPYYNGPNGYARLQGDALLNFHHTFFNDWKTSLLVGNTIWEEKMNYTYDNTSSLVVPGFYNVSYSGGSPFLYQSTATIRQISYFGDLNIGYKGWANLEATLRNDQDSRLNPASNSFWYPSIKGSFIPTDAFPVLKSNVLGYVKVYADVSKVGQVSLAPYNINPTFVTTSGFPFGNLDGFGTSGVNYPPGLKPEQITEFEFGAEFGLFNDRLDIKGDYYNQKSKNQTLSISTSPATGYNSSVINAGEVQSQGEEFSLNAIVIPKGANSVGWNVGGNFAINNSKVLSLVGTSQQLFLGGNSYAVVGKAFPQVFATDYNRDPQGHIIIDPTTGEGTPHGTPVDEGSASPKYNLGLNTSVSYKIVTLTVVAEYRGGDVIYNGLGPEMTFSGSDAFSSQAGRQIFILPNSVINTGTAANPVYTKNTTIPVPSGGINYWVNGNSVTSYQSNYVTSAAFWKIREVSLDFNLNKYVRGSKAIKGLTLGLDARNLFTFLPKSEMWGDPELSSSGVSQGTGGNTNAIGASGTNQLPSTRYFGAKLQVTF